MGGGIDNQQANVYSGKCSCFCGGDWGAYSDSLSIDAKYTKSSGTTLLVY